MSHPPVDIITACRDPAIFGRWFADPRTWAAWFVVMKALFGIALDAEELAIFQKHTGRTTPAPAGYSDATLVIGRRGGKSLILAVVAAYFAAFHDWRPFLTGGERATIMIIAADRRTAGVTLRYLREMLNVPLLRGLIQRETNELLELSNEVTIEVATASFRTTRGRSIALGIADELAFWVLEGGANPDVEIIGALKPAMATIPGARLLKASSPYARRGVLWTDYRRHYGVENSGVLVWKGTTRDMNPSVPQSFIDEAYADDPAHAAAEYGAEFRSDVESFVSREAVDAVVIGGRYELPPMSGVTYTAFCDPAGGGGGDSMTLAIAHRHNDTAILDVLREARPPFSPEAVVEDFSRVLKSYGLHDVTSDRWAGNWPAERFATHSIDHKASPRTKSEIYRDFLPALNGGRVELLDNAKMIAQLCALERKTARGGRNSIDHPPGQHDDLVNVAAGALTSLIEVAPDFYKLVSMPWSAVFGQAEAAIEDATENFSSATIEFEAGRLSGRQLYWYLAEKARRANRRVDEI